MSTKFGPKSTKHNLQKKIIINRRRTTEDRNQSYLSAWTKHEASRENRESFPSQLNQSPNSPVWAPTGGSFLPSSPSFSWKIRFQIRRGWTFREVFRSDLRTCIFLLILFVGGRKRGVIFQLWIKQQYAFFRVF
jgi:hypothetical protein